MPRPGSSSDKSSAQSGLKNVLSSDVLVTGNLKFTGELVFDGKLQGEISTDGSLSLGENAEINGNIAATSVVARGKITGTIVAKDKIEIKAKTELFGDIRAAKLVIEEGVTFVGKCDVNPNNAGPLPMARPGAEEELDPTELVRAGVR
jgi:cytoskeletal protein CcmA (bactofilin family)